MFHDYQEKKESLPLLTSKDSKLHATFELFPSTTVIANTLRRQILVSTPSIGFDTFTITKNTTPLPNEMVSHRISMIPIAGDPATFESKKLIFRLNIKNETDATIDVTASDFIVIELDPSSKEEGILRSTKEFFPPDPVTGQTCLITRLRPQWNPTNPPESIVLTATASVGTGSMNIRWSPVSQCSYENTPDTDKTRQKDMFEQWVKEHKNIEEGADISTMDRLRKEFDTMEVKRCFKVNELGEPNHFTFYMESVGIRTIPAIVMDGILACKTLVETYKDIDTMIPSNVKFQKGDTRYSTVECIFQNENHTLGNLLQTYLIHNHIEGSKEPRITYAGYKIPHPLRPEMVVVIALPTEGDPRPDETEIGIARYAIAQVCRSLSDYFEEMAADWNRTTGVPRPSIAAPSATLTSANSTAAPVATNSVPAATVTPVATNSAAVTANSAAATTPVTAPVATNSTATTTPVTASVATNLAAATTPVTAPVATNSAATVTPIATNSTATVTPVATNSTATTPTATPVAPVAPKKVTVKRSKETSIPK